jgi:hypothetical protein
MKFSKFKHRKGLHNRRLSWTSVEQVFLREILKHTRSDVNGVIEESYNY